MSDSLSPTEAASDSALTKPSPIKIAALSTLFVFLVILFTILKLPEARITGLLQSYVQTALDPYGIYLTDRGRSLSLLTGIRYSLDHPTLELPDQTRIELDDLTVKPNFLSLFSGRFGANAILHQGSSMLDLDAFARKDKIESQVNLKEIDLGKFGILSFAGLKGSGLISGATHLDGSVNDFSSFNGNIDLQIKNLQLEEQNLMGFKLPAIRVASGTLAIDIKNGKLIFKNVVVGKTGDDLFGTVTGDITLNRYLNSSLLNLRITFGVSDKVRGALSLLESMLEMAIQTDGRYAYKLTGPLASPMGNPDPQK